MHLIADYVMERNYKNNYERILSFNNTLMNDSIDVKRHCFLILMHTYGISDETVTLIYANHIKLCQNTVILLSLQAYT